MQPQFGITQEMITNILMVKRRNPQPISWKFKSCMVQIVMDIILQNLRIVIKKTAWLPPTISDRNTYIAWPSWYIKWTFVLQNVALKFFQIFWIHFKNLAVSMLYIIILCYVLQAISYLLQYKPDSFCSYGDNFGGYVMYLQPRGLVEVQILWFARWTYTRKTRNCC